MKNRRTLNKNSNYIQEIYAVVERIPKGKVTTYTQIAITVNRELKSKNIKRG